MFWNPGTWIWYRVLLCPYKKDTTDSMKHIKFTNHIIVISRSLLFKSVYIIWYIILYMCVSSWFYQILKMSKETTLFLIPAYTNLRTRIPYSVIFLIYKSIWECRYSTNTASAFWNPGRQIWYRELIYPYKKDKTCAAIQAY